MAPAGDIGSLHHLLLSRHGGLLHLTPTLDSFRRIREEEAGRLLRSVAYSCAAGHGGSAVVDIGERVCRAMNDTVVRSAVGGRCARRDEFLRELHRAVVLTSGFNLALSELTRNPRAMRRAQAEVREAFRGQQRLTEADTARLRYLPLVVKETLRLHVPVPFLLPRECREACRVMGYDVPRGTKVLVSAWAIARDAAYWDDTEVFRPQRFEGTGGVYFRGTDFEFIPFGAGRRMCPGMALGLVNMELALAGLLYHFDWTLSDGDGKVLDMSEAFGITVKRKSKLVLRATPRAPCS
ncbi:unnamed protein product [Miscanthus lutarioriparius]|uniref:Cytochrome P450 n=1 Tax=Miscanthus lutarioriparius TaxID=422564 RepID=A0A811N0E3_9POAL|nr:unnamed protein product [Miscanthus lutarioriparius]